MWIFTIFILALHHFSQAPPQMARLRPLVPLPWHPISAFRGMMVPTLIDQYLLTELEKGHVAGPFSMSPLPNLHISRFGIILKKYKPSKWQLLSSPQAHSVMTGFLKTHFHFSTWSLTIPLMASSYHSRTFS